eukprot:CAMPEP_0198116750 /NCGR_PEP_ID=MMETSP1442-20131203/14437_1 /TAXON_ID= /ORGANISM="Craspedostauros australis, Strain CCMP3328" /LENGTH=115 /DNA_ID=CAMNT_0043774653 /DNA_START=345 /DNA_END=692 /DNA_ORIENTATION=-
MEGMRASYSELATLRLCPLGMSMDGNLDDAVDDDLDDDLDEDRDDAVEAEDMLPLLCLVPCVRDDLRRPTRLDEAEYELLRIPGMLAWCVVLDAVDVLVVLVGGWRCLMLCDDGS